MELTKELLDNEIRQAERTVAQYEQQVVFAKGGLTVLRQLRELLDREADAKAE